MELRVAKALSHEAQEMTAFGTEFDSADALRLARAAIRAMREPTVIVTGPGYSASDIWRSTIDAASPTSHSDTASDAASSLSDPGPA
jgi:hypothetical protein